MKTKIFFSVFIALFCILIIFIYFYLPSFERSLSDGNVIINCRIEDSKLTKSFICSYKCDNPFLNEIWLEKKMWRNRSYKNLHIYSLRFTTQKNIEKLELLFVDINYSGLGKADSVYFIETDDMNILLKEKIFCKLKINGIIHNLYLKRIGVTSEK